VVSEDIGKLASKVEEINLKGLDYAFVVKTMLEYLKHILFAKATGSFSEKELTADEISYFKNVSGKIDENKAFALFQVFQKLLQDLKFYDLQQYVFEFGMYKAANISRVIRSDVSPASSSYLEEHRGAENTKLTSEKDLNDNDKIWQLLLDKLAEKNPATSANLSHGYIISSDANEMKIGFAEEKKFHYDIINKKEHLALLKSVMKSFFDDERKLSVILEKGSKKKA